MLERFLRRLCAALEEEHAAGHDVQAILGQARSFLARAQRPATTISEKRFVTEPASLPLPSHPVFQAFRPRERVSIPERAGAVSDCLLRLRPGLQETALRGIILADLRLHEQLSRSAGEIRVWDRYSLRMLQERPETLARIQAAAQTAGYLVVEAKDLFLERLYHPAGIEGEQGFAQHPAGARDHLLPFSPLVMALLEPAELARACQFADGGAGGATVALRLLFADGSDVTLSRHYPGKEDELEPPFSLSVWPNFRADWWHLHLAYAGAVTDIQFVTAGFVSLQGMVRHLSRATDGFSAVAAARSLVVGDVTALAETTWLAQTQQVARALFMLPGAAEAAVLEDRRAGTRRPAGLLLLPEPASAPATSGSSATVGIDFGTTNTAVHIRSGADTQPVPLRIEPRHIIAYRLAEQSRDELDVELLPVSPIDKPFQTILRDRMLDQSGSERRPFRDTLIYFAQRRKAALDRAVSSADLFANLKWGEDEHARGRIELFLSQVVILALAEAGARGIPPRQVAFRFSHPEAFRPHQLIGFKAAARNAVARGLAMATGSEPTERAEPGYQTESVATAQYLHPCAPDAGHRRTGHIRHRWPDHRRRCGAEPRTGG